MKQDKYRIAKISTVDLTDGSISISFHVQRKNIFGKWNTIRIPGATYRILKYELLTQAETVLDAMINGRNKVLKVL